MAREAVEEVWGLERTLRDVRFQYQSLPDVNIILSHFCSFALARQRVPDANWVCCAVLKRSIMIYRNMECGHGYLTLSCSFCKLTDLPCSRMSYMLFARMDVVQNVQNIKSNHICGWSANSLNQCFLPVGFIRYLHVITIHPCWLFLVLSVQGLRCRHPWFIYYFAFISIFSLCLDILHAVQMQTKYAETEDATKVSSWHQIRDAAAIQCVYYPQAAVYSPSVWITLFLAAVSSRPPSWFSSLLWLVSSSTPDPAPLTTTKLVKHT